MGHADKHDMDKLHDMVDGISNIFPKIHYINIPTVFHVKYPSIYQDIYHPYTTLIHQASLFR